MAAFRIRNTAKEDVIRTQPYRVEKLGITQVDKYFDSFFEYFHSIAHRPYSFQSVDFIKKGYRRCVYGSDSILFKANEDVVDIITIIGRQDLENTI
ncbi:type II toxin-antitoxin system RelE/ParE family toxin [Lacinutrix sp. MEBiC02595]